MTVTYDPTTDPMRVDEATLREAIKPSTLLPGGLTVINQGDYTKGGKGSYAAVTVLCYRADAPFPGRAFSTHVAYVPAEADGPRRPESQSGHYDLTLAEALADLASR